MTARAWDLLAFFSALPDRVGIDALGREHHVGLVLATGVVGRRLLLAATAGGTATAAAAAQMSAADPHRAKRSGAAVWQYQCDERSTPTRGCPRTRAGSTSRTTCWPPTSSPFPAASVGDVPSDPIHTPHDVLAAEEFAIPGAGAGDERPAGASTRAPCCRSLLLVATILLLIRRHRSHG